MYHDDSSEYLAHKSYHTDVTKREYMPMDTKVK